MTRWGLTTYKANSEMWTFQQQRILGCEYETMPGTPGVFELLEQLRLQRILLFQVNGVEPR